MNFKEETYEILGILSESSHTRKLETKQKKDEYDLEQNNNMRRRLALQYKQTNPEMLKKDAIAYKNNQNEKSNIDSKYDKVISFDGSSRIKSKKYRKADEIDRNFEDICDSFDTFLHNHPNKKEAREIWEKTENIKDRFRKGENPKEIVNDINKVKKEMIDFIKNHRDEEKFNY